MPLTKSQIRNMYKKRAAYYNLSKREPWVPMRKYFSKVTVQEAYRGFVHIAVDEK
jgi:hypothetical protein